MREERERERARASERDRGQERKKVIEGDQSCLTDQKGYEKKKKKKKKKKMNRDHGGKRS